MDFIVNPERCKTVHFFLEICGRVMSVDHAVGMTFSPPTQDCGIIYFCSPAIRLIVRATTKVFKPKESSPWRSAMRLIFRDEISTSDTWNVQPITKEK